VLFILAVLSSAQAYQCGPDSWRGAAYPEDGAVQVPTNSHIVWEQGSDWYSDGFQLFDDTGALVQTTEDASMKTRGLVPLAPLSPNTTYTLVDEYGMQTFTTSAVEDLEPPEGGHITEVRETINEPGVFYMGDTSIGFVLSDGTDAYPVHFEIEVRTSDGDPGRIFRFASGAYLHNTGCWPNFGFSSPWEMCVRSRAIDMSGNVGVWSPEFQVSESGEDVVWCNAVRTGTEGEPVPAGGGLDEDRATPDSGPASCGPPIPPSGAAAMFAFVAVFGLRRRA